MAYANVKWMEALRNKATHLSNGAHYAWANHGASNCGKLLQQVTHLSKEELLRHVHAGIGEWPELSAEYCGVAGTPVDIMISHLQDIGLTATDIHNIEYLEDKEVLQQLPGGFRWLQRNVREDVIMYFETFADMLETKLIARELRFAPYICSALPMPTA